MTSNDLHDTRDFWNDVADDWRTQVGDDGDPNRRLNSDPVLWQLVGNVRGHMVLDAGCGTGYLSKKLHDRGASVTGIDFSERMIEIARASYPGIDFRVDSCTTLVTLDANSFDLLVANYVLMDVPDLTGTMQAFNRVLKPEGAAALIFSHPCFPQGRAAATEEGDGVTYRWDHSYFEQRRCVDPPWGHFTSDFIWFHRPLSDYWKAFREAGFGVEEFEEPRITGERYHLVDDERKIDRNRSRPYSVAFKLRKHT